jgi:Cu-Zn family superoxide dismutase
VLAITLVGVGCTTYEGKPETNEAEAGPAPEPTAMVAVAELQPTSGSETHGTVTFRAVEGGVRVEAELSKVSQGAHGFHVHETGDCSAPDGTSAGGHFAPQGSPHGAPDDPQEQRHVGDLGNIEANGAGNAVYDRVDELLSLDGEQSIVGKAVIVHANPDDLESQPTGAAGARVACGVIELQSDENLAGGLSGS